MAVIVVAGLHWFRAEPVLPIDLSTSPRIAVTIIQGTSLGVGILLVVGLVRAVITLAGHSKIPGEIITTEVLERYRKTEVIDRDTVDSFTRRRIQLEQQLRGCADNKRLVFHWVGDCHLPFTTGFFIPTISCPIWITQVQDGVFLDVLLRHEALHVKMGHHRINLVLAVVGALMPWFRPMIDAVQCSMEMEVDQLLVMESNSQASIYKEALVAVVSRAEDAALVGIGHDPRRLASRLERLKGTRGSGAGWFVASLVSSIALLGCSVGIGTPELHAFMKILRQDLGRDLRVAHKDPGFLVLRNTLPAGVFETGIIADTTNIRRAGVYFDKMWETPFEAKGTVKIHIKYRVAGDGPVVPVTAAFAHTNRLSIGSSWRQDVILQDLNAKELDPSRQETTLELSCAADVNKRTPWYIQGPRFLVPKGWKVFVQEVRMEVLQTSGPNLNQKELGSKLEYYFGLRDRTLGKSTEAEVFNLSWRSKNGITGI